MSFLGFTLGAESEKFKPNVAYLVIARTDHTVFKGKRNLENDIIDFTTFRAAHMVMFCKIRLESSLAPWQIQFANLAMGHQYLQVPVDCSQTDPWQALSHPLINFVRGWMKLSHFQFFQDNSTLMRQSECSASCHTWCPIKPVKNDNHYYLIRSHYQVNTSSTLHAKMDRRQGFTKGPSMVFSIRLTGYVIIVSNFDLLYLTEVSWS